jgi:hypothetical protein
VSFAERLFFFVLSRLFRVLLPRESFDSFNQRSCLLL